MNIGSFIAVGLLGAALVGAAANLPPRALTEGDFEALVSRSDDLERYGTAFSGAARWLYEAGICSEYDLRQSGGWAKSRTHRNRPIYFTYCGGSALADRVYFDAETLEFYGRARGSGERVRLAG
ncbi:hypothetical protein [Nitratireductor sp. XY-223]|uniref:hypothetical protein n=1 Tax=Nitratireductor sp. XY-223 TaxID=2561926 RepID=UPI0010AB0A00|nr:hypothetical protein [Nitratireductor sp. XY-223]